ncbi:flagellum-specific ATP synthase FliI [Meridianimarinicoccus roseus]|uniref:Flagellum-specific ATP synthase n=1 Tax=Meridianimarinicoccus roseus TaxID=2072018 RepID=A0A2V2LFD2_9RHOB|nr:FliI/YscN family ATPase [Meridianimarinicoccus roseus]PWR02601.1 flagellum-specific ATP synthase FliI [Meridianimarinicoccus roseus]
MSALARLLGDELRTAAAAPLADWSGQVLRYDGLIVECAGFPAAPGSRCRVETLDGAGVTGEIVGFADGRNMLFLDRPGARIVAGARVTLLDDGSQAAVGPGLLGRVLDADGAPLDGGAAPDTPDTWPLAGREMNPLIRTPVDTALDVGVRAINAALTVGRGQRVGIIAGSGVGKSVLIEMMTKSTTADVIVVGLIGERAREVGAFVSKVMTGEAAARVCIVAVPADRSPLLRLRGAQRATAIAEYFRAEGKQVLLIMDSLTRVAHAKREVGLALGEQPTAKGYPPSVVSMIPQLLERAGPGLPGEGAITAFYTILADGDDTNDPVVDGARAILDGHLVLSRKQAQMGMYPAIDIPQSVSRVMNDVVDPEHRAAARKLRAMVADYMENRDLMLMGGYSEGQDAALDTAIAHWPAITRLLRQNEEEKADFDASRAQLLAVTADVA